MASVAQYQNGWRAQVYVKGRRDSQTFAKRREAEEWAALRTIELRNEAGGRAGEGKTLRDALRRYAEEHACSNRGEKWEILRLAAFERMPLPLNTALRDLTPLDFNRWRAARQAEVKDGTVLREISLLESVFKQARREWHWIDESPLKDMVKPNRPKDRDRTFTWSETKRMLRGLGYRTGQSPKTKSQVIASALLLALRTGMRSGEIVGLTWENVLDNHLILPKTKNGTLRKVPLSRAARRLMATLDGPKPFPITDKSRDARFRTIRDRLGLVDLTFHDSRHTAATRIGRTVGHPGRYTFPEFCKVFGWKDPKKALIYVNPSIDDLAARAG